ncbi:MAG: anhydro-N-acetylmuramic acid kinase, partial [Ignavibacteriae bacterium]|nr:anhydro-N-acetylmuramic acid kinase [Ignavibacteriota bacterium]
MDLIELVKKKERKVVGILSGTSVDAVDVALLHIKSTGFNTSIQVIDFQSFKIPNNLKEYILKCSRKGENDVEDICKLNFLIGRLFANCINKFLKARNISNKSIDLIGSHGQTIYHIPKISNEFGIKTKSTLQVGDPSVIANLTGIVTIGDFRNADVAVDGDGAPLVPYLDYILFTDKNKSRILINIGGIANLTYLKKNCKIDEVIAFDSGPGNMLIDGLCREFFDLEYDKDSKIALKGNVNKNLFEYICNKDKYFKSNPPKSTGREYYGKEFLKKIINKSRKISKEDIIRTVTEYTAYSIYYNIKHFIGNINISEILVSGGGAENLIIMNSLKSYFSESLIGKFKYKGINTANKEAVLFAVLANETISQNYNNVPSATGAKKKVILGKICP